MTRLPGGASRRFRVALHRIGEPVTIEESDDPATNDYGKVEDEDRTWSEVEPNQKHVAHRIYTGSDGRPNEVQVLGGRVDTDAPLIAFAADTVAKEGDHITFPDGETYSLDDTVPYRAYTAFRSTLLTDG